MASTKHRSCAWLWYLCISQFEFVIVATSFSLSLLFFMDCYQNLSCSHSLTTEAPAQCLVPDPGVESIHTPLLIRVQFYQQRIVRWRRCCWWSHSSLSPAFPTGFSRFILQFRQYRIEGVVTGRNSILISVYCMTVYSNNVSSWIALWYYARILPCRDEAPHLLISVHRADIYCWMWSSALGVVFRSRFVCSFWLFSSRWKNTLRLDCGTC